MKKYIPYMIITILLIIIASGATYLLMQDNNEKNNIQNNIPDNEDNSNKNNKQVELNEKEIEKYLSYVPFLDASLVLNDTYIDAYDGNKNTIDKINKEIILYNVYKNTKEHIFKENEQRPIFYNLDICNNEPCNEDFIDSYYKESDINGNLLKMYNINSLKFDYLAIPGGGLFYQNSYYGTHFGAGSEAYYKFSKNITSVKTQDYITIEEEAIFLREASYDNDSILKEGKNLLKIYKNTSDMKNNKNVLKSIYIDNNIEKEHINLENYGNFTYTKYKHTFKKNNEGYYWYRTEVV